VFTSGVAILMSSSFVVSLESEIRRLQKQIAARKGENPSLVEPSRAQEREVSDVESLVSDFGFLSVAPWP
jgi:cell division protein FtsB